MTALLVGAAAALVAAAAATTAATPTTPAVPWRAPAATPSDAAPAAADLAELAAPERERRLEAVLRVGAAARPEGLARMVPLLDDADDAVRIATARALARAGVEAGIAQAARWASAPQPALRVEGLLVLREAAALSREARQAALRALADGEVAVRLAAVRALGAHPATAADPDAAAAVERLAAALDDGNREVRQAAFRLLGATGDRRAVVPLLERVDDPERATRLWAIGALGALGDARAGAALVRQLDDSGEDVRRAAIEALGRVRFAPAVAALADLLASRPDDRVGREAALALGAIAAGKDELRGADAAAARAAVAALAARLATPPIPAEVGEGLRRAGPEAVPALVAALADALPSGAAVAARVLGASGDRRATAPLAAALRQRPLVAAAAAEALGKLGDPDAVPALVAAVAARPPARSALGSVARRACLAALAALRDDRAAEIADAAARDPAPDVRAEALALAAALGAGLTRATLLAGLADADAAVRRQAVRAAAALAALAPAPALAAAIAAHPDETAAIADALEATALPTDRDALLDVAGRAPAGAARAAILRALAGIPAPTPSRAPASPAFEATLVAALATPDEARAAAELLAAWPLRDRTADALARAVPTLDPALRARLAPALARAARPTTDAALLALLADPDPAVRAAAAWSAVPRRHLAAVAAALTTLTRSHSPAAINAAAALTVGTTSTSWSRVRTRAPDGTPLPYRWLTLTLATNPILTIWSRTDATGESLVPVPAHTTIHATLPLDQTPFIATAPERP